MRKRQDVPKLKQFSLKGLDVLENEIFSICNQCRSGKYNIGQSMDRLHECKGDLTGIYWYISMLINQCQGHLKNRAEYIRFSDRFRTEDDIQDEVIQEFKHLSEEIGEDSVTEEDLQIKKLHESGTGENRDENPKVSEGS